jgi:Cys-rich protein (TIGR01571 family)
METKANYSSIEATAEPIESGTMVDVDAPDDLPEGYTFQAIWDGVTFPVTVPPGGVTKGQTLSVPFNPSARGPGGGWNDDLFACTRFGIFHPSCLNACCCPLILIGQLLTRLGLNWKGKPATPEEMKQTTSIMIVCFIVYTIVIICFGESTGSWTSLLQLVYGVYILVMLMRLRKLIRTKYQIPEHRCIGCEDLCCAFWCGCCTISQLARQTADYDVEDATFFTSTGVVSPEITSIV